MTRRRRSAAKPLEVVQQERWERAVQELENIVPLWYYHAARLELTSCRGWCNTAAVDGIRLYFNPEFTQSLSDAQLRFLLIHEVMHVVFGHLWRASRHIDKVAGLDDAERNRRHAIMNEAQDYAIHQIVKPLIDSGYYKDLEFIPSGLYDPQYNNMGAEAIYDILIQQDRWAQPTLDLHIQVGSGAAPAGAETDGRGNWVKITDQAGNSVQPGPGEPGPQPINPRDLQRIIRAEVEQLSSQAGTGLGHVVRQIEVDARRAREDWKARLADFLILQARTDYSYSRPNRRYLSQGLVVPGLRSEILHGVIAVDTSGSINRGMLNRFFSEIEGIRSQLPDHVLDIICCDDDVREVQHVESGGVIQSSTTGGGGTSFWPVFWWVRDQGFRPTFLLYFTDGHSRTRVREQPEYPVLWVLYGSDPRKQLWGEHIILQD